MNRGRFVTLLACCLLICIVFAGSAAGASGFIQEDIDPDDVLMSISVEDDGDTTWIIEYRIRLDTDEDRQAFEDLRDDIESDPEPYTERFQNRMNATAENAEEATGREMAISEMSVSTEKRELPQEYGVVTYSFRWSNFAAVDEDRLLVGDAIDGLFLDDETSLLVSWSGSYELLDASPTPTETRQTSIVYEGPTNFGSGEPRMELGPPGAAPSDDASRRLPFSPVLIAALVVLLLAGGVGAAIYRRGGPVHVDTNDGDDEQSTGAPAPGNSPDSELLSNEEQVLRLIEQHGGRMKQKKVAEELEWTDAKTSQVTKTLRERGGLEGFRLGRENVLSLPGDQEE